jgi:phenylpropionate dioxygenase-like ring-hydroxylating dioxygenase large terminal subunit
MSEIEKRFPFGAYPYAKTVNRTARLRTWPTVERAGAVFVWHSAASTEPEWELPKIPESGEMKRMGLGFARGEGAITEFRAWARQSCEEAFP